MITPAQTIQKYMETKEYPDLNVYIKQSWLQPTYHVEKLLELHAQAYEERIKELELELKQKNMEKKLVGGIPRRIILDQLTAEEKQLWELTQAIEALGAHPLLTDVVVKLGEAREALANYVELESNG